MEKYFNKSVHKLETAIHELEIETDCSIQKTETVIKLIVQSLSDLKEYVLKNGFKNLDEEIHFFKKVKPHLFCKLIYYRKICNIETSRPAGSNMVIKNYLVKELDKIQYYFEKNIEFYKYYRNSHTHFDNYYFLRGKPDIQLTLDSFYFERDPKFSTSYDFTVAKILANDMLIVYINKELVKLDKHIEDQTITPFPKVKETWTRSKTDLIELIYALCETNCFNFGRINLKRLTNYFENVFNIDLGDVYHTYLSMRGRINRTQFLDELKEKLNAKMNKDDQ